MSREAMKLALEALEGSIALTMPKIDLRKEAITALREALAQPQPEPVGEITMEDIGRPFNSICIRTHFYECVPPVGTKLYTSPPDREPLTVEQIEEVWMAYEKARPKNSSNHESRLQFARAIEAAHGIKEAS